MKRILKNLLRWIITQKKSHQKEHPLNMDVHVALKKTVAILNKKHNKYRFRWMTLRKTETHPSTHKSSIDV